MVFETVKLKEDEEQVVTPVPAPDRVTEAPFSHEPASVRLEALLTSGVLALVITTGAGATVSRIQVKLTGDEAVPAALTW